MNRENCERICLAAMAIMDGEDPPIPLAEIEFHLAQCGGCRNEVEQMRTIIELLSGQRRRERTERVWDGVAATRRQRNEARTSLDHWLWFLLLGLLLAGYRIVAATSDWEPGWWFKLAPILLAIAVFGFLRENPFKVNPILQSQISLRGNL